MQNAKLKTQILDALIVLLDQRECYGSANAVHRSLDSSHGINRIQAELDDLVSLGYVFKMNRGVTGQRTSVLGGKPIIETGALKFPVYNITQAGRNALALHTGAVV